MRLSGRLSATIAVLEDFEGRKVPLKTALADWARSARYAGAKDRAFISGLALDILRRRRTLAAAMDDASARAAALAALRALWGLSAEEIAAAAGEAPHGPGALSAAEAAKLSDLRPGVFDRPPAAGGDSPGDFPEAFAPQIRRAFGEAAGAEMAALSARADVDLRINTLRTDPERAMRALARVGASAHAFLKTAARIAAPPPSEKTPDLTVIPAFGKGWVEVQDAGSQIAALAAGEIRGAQVLDFCAGGGGKTLALAAQMANKGQLYAYDADAARLKPLYERARRAGVRNLQIVNPLTDEERLGSLAGRMDVVFIDAPCSGSGVWRRHPDSKWRLTPDQLARRTAEQDRILNSAADFVKPGGRMIYVTCSIFAEENEDRIAHFLGGRPQFKRADALERAAATGLLTEEGAAALAACRTAAGDLRLTPLRVRTDGFFIAHLPRER